MAMATPMVTAVMLRRGRWGIIWFLCGCSRGCCGCRGRCGGGCCGCCGRCGGGRFRAIIGWGRAIGRRRTVGWRRAIRSTVRSSIITASMPTAPVLVRPQSSFLCQAHWPDNMGVENFNSLTTAKARIPRNKTEGLRLHTFHDLLAIGVCLLENHASCHVDAW